jgi:hypothetical protein
MSEPEVLALTVEEDRRKGIGAERYPNTGRIQFGNVSM